MSLALAKEHNLTADEYARIQTILFGLNFDFKSISDNLRINAINYIFKKSP